MKKIFFLLTSICMFINIFGQFKNDEKEKEAAFYKATKNWFLAWKLVSKEIYKINTVTLVDFVFFDDKYVYSTSTTTIKNGKAIKGSNLLNLSLTWKKKLHNDTIILPDKSIVPIRLMSFAAEIPDKRNKAFFVMPLPSFWKKSGIESKDLGIENLITGVFIHEFSHSQQMQNFGKGMTLLEKQNNFGVEFSDDIVQDIFSKDSNYLKLYNEELKKFYLSVQGQTFDRVLVKDGLELMSHRHIEYFKGQFLSLKEIDVFFLTMEGLGQYSMYLWLTHPKGGNLKKDIVINGVRRGGKWWSQDEGFALFLILDKLSKPDTWAKNMFGHKTESVIDLIGKHLP